MAKATTNKYKDEYVAKYFYQFQSNHFPRFRLGIGTNENMRPSEKYVLKPFHSDDNPTAEMMVKNCADAIDNLLVKGLDNTMNQFNS